MIDAGAEPGTGGGGDRAQAGTPACLEYRVVDAFSDRPFQGNPAAVILPADLVEEGMEAGGLPESLLQAIAAEMNLSETAFPHPPGPDGVRRLRWFTPTTEVSLCGHATLAAAHALVEAGASLPLRFDSRSGPLDVDRGVDGGLRLNFPADPATPTSPPPELLSALGLPGNARVRYGAGLRCAVLELEEGGEAALEGLAPDMQSLRAVELPAGVMGISVTVATGSGEARAGSNQGEGRQIQSAAPAFRSRFFGPWVGVDEDPVTGMAHCVLAPWWEARLGLPPGTPMHALQGGTRRGSLGVRVLGDRVHLSGAAVTVAAGTLRLRT